MQTWQTVYKDSLKNLESLRVFFQDSPEHLNALVESFDESTYPIFIPKNLAYKIKSQPTGSALWNQFIPNDQEFLRNSPNQSLDPIGDQIHQKTKQLIHRYPTRALFLPTNTCPVHCRYCFRKNELYQEEKVFSADFEKTLQYLKDHTEINELIFTGGDPFILSDRKINSYLEEFSKISHLKFIRFHSRTPIIIPQRLTTEFIEILKQFSSRFHLLISLHINHIDEWSPELQENILKLSSFTTLLAQTVLLKDVNNSTKALIDLFTLLSENRITPYYLHHPDRAAGTRHFWLSLEQGRKIYQKLRLHLSGWMIPQYIFDIPNGYGKTPAYNPESTHFSGQIIDIYGKTHNLSKIHDYLDKPKESQ